MNKSISSRISRLCLAILIALSALFVMGSALSQATQAIIIPLTVFTVSNANDTGAGSLRQAIVDANTTPGADVIDITAVGTVNLLNPLPTITESLTIQGPGAELFRIDGQDLYRVFDIAAVNGAISDLTIQRGAISGTEANGGGIRSVGNLSLSHVRVLSNTAQQGGGGLYVVGQMTVTNSLFQNNRSTHGGGGALRTNSRASISGTHFLDNTSQGDGGAVFALGQNLITNGQFQDNQCLAISCDGGGLFAFSRTTLRNTQFLSNTAQDHGGGAYIAGIVTVTNGLFQHNQSVFASGGGLGAQDTVVVQTTHFLENLARGAGGGMSVFGSLLLSDALFQDNQSTTSRGGGLNAQGNVEVDGVKFIGNTAHEGGALAHTLFDAYLVNSLFVANVATDAVGTAVLLASSGTAEMLHLTIVGQPSANGAAIDVTTGTAGITNTIVTGHAVGISSTGTAVFQNFNLFFGNGVDTLGTVSGGPNSLVGDPLFLDPAGGDYHLVLASPAVDTGTEGGVTRDFDRDVRPLGAGYDIGFDEVIQAPGTPTPEPTIIPRPSPTAEPTPTPAPTSTALPTPITYTIFLPIIRQ